MPNLQALICNEGLATKYYAETHSAIGNYFTLASGQILTNNDNYTPGSSMSCSDSSTVACSNSGLGYQTVDNIAKEMEAAYGAGGWKGYVECIPYAGYTTSTAIQTCPSGVPPCPLCPPCPPCRDERPRSRPEVVSAHRKAPRGTLPAAP